VKGFGEDKVVGCSVDGWGDEEKNGGSYPCPKVIGISRGPNFEGETDCVVDLISQKWMRSGTAY
jgi:hypothetical protein